MQVDAVHVLKKLRVSQGLSIREIAQVLNWSPATVHRRLVEHGIDKEGDDGEREQGDLP